MLTKDELEKKLKDGGEVSEKMKNAMALWSVMYDNNAPWCNDKVKSLNLSAAIAAEVARLATVEMKSEILGGKRAEFLNKAYQPVLENLRRFVEYGCAKGGMVLKPYVSGNKILVDFIQADKFFPTAFDSTGRITGAIFVGKIKKDGVIYTRLEEHLLENRIYKITNRAYSSRTEGVLGREIPLNQVSEWKNISPQIAVKNVDRLLVGYFKVPYANAVDPSSPLGVSVFARAADLICEADRQYSRLLWEFESGERALYVSDMAFRVDKNGRAIIPDKRLYRLLSVEQNGDDLFSDWTPSLRDENILRGLNAILRKVEFNCGLAYGTLSDVDNVDKTAEEIRASKQRSFSMISDVQKSLAKALEELVYAMDVLCNLYELAPVGKCLVSFEFDDSTVTDRNAEFLEKQQLVTSGIMQPWEFRMWYFGETEEIAKKAVSKTVFKTDTGAA